MKFTFWAKTGTRRSGGAKHQLFVFFPLGGGRDLSLFDAIKDGLVEEIGEADGPDGKQEYTTSMPIAKVFVSDVTFGQEKRWTNLFFQFVQNPEEVARLFHVTVTSTETAKSMIFEAIAQPIPRKEMAGMYPIATEGRRFIDRQKRYVREYYESFISLKPYRVGGRIYRMKKG